MTRLPVTRCGIRRRRVRCCALGVWAFVGAAWPGTATAQTLLPRDVLVVTTADIERRFERLRFPLQHLGLRPRAIRSGSELLEVDPTRLCGILTWFRAGESVPARLWAATRELLGAHRRLRWVHVGSLRPLRTAAGDGALSEWLATRGMDWRPRPPVVVGRVHVRRGEHTALEAAPVFRRAHGGPRVVGPGDRTWVTTWHGEGAAKEIAHPVVTGRWGGLALDPYFARQAVSTPASVPPTATDGLWAEDFRFHVDPFRFFYAAFGLEGRPVPDANVRHGHRVAYFAVHSAAGHDPLDAADARRVSGWLAAQSRPWTVLQDVGPALAVPSHCERGDRLGAEVLGARPNPRAAMVCWLDSSDPRGPARSALGSVPQVVLHAPSNPANRLDASHRTVADLAPLWTRVADLAGGFARLPVADGPTDAVRGDLDAGSPTAFERILPTLRNTGQPRILQPLGIHLGARAIADPLRRRSAERVLAAVDAMRPVAVRWSEHVAAMAGAANAEVLFLHDSVGPDSGIHGYAVRGLDACRTVRLVGETRAIDWARSPGVLGACRRADALYVSLAAPAAELRFSSTAVLLPHLVSCEAVVESGRRSARGVELGLRASPPARTEPARIVVAGFAAGAEVDVRFGDQVIQRAASDSGELRIEVPSSTVHFAVEVR